MGKRVAINGMGRVGRLVFRDLFDDQEVEVVAVNDIAPIESVAYLLAHSSEYGAFRPSEHIDTEDNHIRIGSTSVTAFRESDATKLPWDELGVDLVLDCSGTYTSRNKAEAHIAAGARRVLVSAAAGPDVPTVVYGINDGILGEDDTIVSGASCSTVGLSPLVQALDNAFSLVSGIATTIHALTPTQMVLDDPQAKGNLRRSRTALSNIIPTSAAFASAVGLVLPQVQGKLTGYAIRVPVAQGSLITLYAVVDAPELAPEDVNTAMYDRRSSLFGYTDEELVSSDIARTEFYSIFDATQTKASPLPTGQTLVEVAAWFDNETSYVSHFTKLARRL